MSGKVDATPAQLRRAHTDPELFARWVGPNGMQIKILDWEATTGGRWRYVAGRDGEEYAFHGCFHDVGEDTIVQTFTFEGFPDGVALETMVIEDLGNGRTRMVRVRDGRATIVMTPYETAGRNGTVVADQRVETTARTRQQLRAVFAGGGMGAHKGVTADE